MCSLGKVSEIYCLVIARLIVYLSAVCLGEGAEYLFVCYSVQVSSICSDLKTVIRLLQCFEKKLADKAGVDFGGFGFLP